MYIATQNLAQSVGFLVLAFVCVTYETFPKTNVY